MKRKLILAQILLLLSTATVLAQIDQKELKKSTQTPLLRKDHSAQQLYIKMLQIEDERSVPSDFIQLLNHGHAGVRKHALLSLGRIGDRTSVGPISEVLLDDGNAKVREMAAFALGEIEDVKGVPTLISAVLNKGEVIDVRARAAEALGKIASVPENAKPLGADGSERITNLLIGLLPKPASEIKPNQDQLITLILTALMRIHAPSAIEPVTAQLASPNPQVRFVAGNSLARILASNPSKSNKAVIDAATIALKDENALVRATAVRVLGATKDPSVVDTLLPLLNNGDEPTQVNLIRALGSLGDKKAVDPLIALGQKLLLQYQAAKDPLASELNRLYLISTALGQLKDPAALPLLKSLRVLPSGTVGGNVETEVAIAHFGLAAFNDYDPKLVDLKTGDWQTIANFANGLGEVGGEAAIKALDDLLSGRRAGKLDVRAIPEVLRAMDKAKTPNLMAILREQLNQEDVIIRATAAELLMQSTADEDFNALANAYQKTTNDKMNDAKLAILMGIAKFNRSSSITILSSALRDNDYLVRKQAAELLKMINAGNVDNKVGNVRVMRDKSSYTTISDRANIEKPPIAIIETSKGRIRIELFHEDAPLTVANFIVLAQKGFFENQLFHRVVPNFVIQTGDPRGDGNGGSGSQIRCEINMRPYQRGTVGMALSGKDTGSSQFFICHSPQPHLEGGYTVFGQVIEGLDVVDKITKGDTIDKVTIENP